MQEERPDLLQGAGSSLTPTWLPSYEDTRDETAAPARQKPSSSRTRSSADGPVGAPGDASFGRFAFQTQRITRQQMRLKEKQDELIKSGLRKTRATIESALSRTSEDVEPDESLPNVFSPFSPVDLIRSNVAPLDAFDETDDEADEADETVDIKILPISSNLDAVATSGTPNAPQVSAQSSSFLTPFSHFFGIGRGQESAGAHPSTSGAVDSPLDDPLVLQPQTSSTPKEQ